jgi:kinesin family protein 3/17
MSNAQEDIRESFDGNEELDLNSVISEFPFGDDNPGKQIPVKKLSDDFDGCLRTDDFMKVFLRIRPIKSTLESTMSVESDTSISTNAPDTSKRAIYTKTEQRNYAFSKVYGPEINQEEVYKTTALPLLKRLCNGESSVLFAYGMTNAGKTYTIQGNQNSAPGILPRLITDILGSRSAKAGVKYSMNISMLEIYQEKVYDLLSTSKEKLSIRDGNGNVEVAKLSTHSISLAKEAVKLMDIASAKRHKSSTGLNTVSSRSHAVYTVTLEQTSIATDEQLSVSSFYLVDLAGAERGNRTKATAVQQQEANSINVSLMKLWRCLQGMRKSKGSVTDIIPFRESKLTHLLVPILGKAGVGGVAMIACVNPQVEDYDETLTVLGHASLAMKIKEITDLGRTTGTQSISSQSMDEPSATSKPTATAAQRSLSTEVPPTKATIEVTQVVSKGAGKRKRVETGSTMVKSLASSLNGFLKGSRQASVSAKTITTITQQLQHQVDKDSAKDTGDTKREGAVVDQRAIEDLIEAYADKEAKMQREIEALKVNNMSLRTYQGQMETEIRAEIAKEMQRSSSNLLEQIQDLRTQLSVYECNTRVDILMKSTKKVRKKQRTEKQADAEKDLEEAEDELERLKTKYEEELSALRKENESLQADLENVMEERDSSSSSSYSSSSSSSTSSSSSSSGVTVPQPLGQFQRSASKSPLAKENVVVWEGNTTVEETVQANKAAPPLIADNNMKEQNLKEKRSSRQVRSPLSPITNCNILVDLTNPSPKDKVNSATKSASPFKSQSFRLAYENAAAVIEPSPVFTRLRSRAGK